MKPISLVDCVFPPLPSEDIFFSLCKGKSLFPNGLGIQYGFREIFLSLQERVFDVIRTKASDCLSSSSTFVWHREKKSPDGKELKSSKPKGKKLNFKTFIVMIYSNFTGRVAKKAKLIDGVNGKFLSMDMAVNDFSKGEEVTQWVRVQTSDPAHLKLAEYFTKGKILTIQGNIKIDQWEGKDGTPHAQLRVHAKYIDFLNIGKKPVSDTNVPDAPKDTPKEKKDDLPF